MKTIFTRAGALIQTDATSRLLLRGSFVSLLLRILGVALSYAVHVLLSRKLGLQEYGRYVIALGWALVFTMPARLGFDQSAMRFGPVYLERGDLGRFRAFTRVALYSVILASLILGAAVVFLSNRLELTGGYETSYAIALIILALAVLGVVSSLARVVGNIFASQFYDQAFRPAMLVAMTCAITILGWRLTVPLALMLTGVSGALALTALGIHVWRVFATTREAQRDYRGWTTWLTVSLPLLVIVMAQELMNQFEVILLGYLASAREAGLFAAASRLANLTPFALVALAAVSAPLIAADYERQDWARLYRVVSLTARLGLAFAVFTSVLLASVGISILRLFGPDFEAAYPALAILLISGLVNAFTGVVAYLLTLTGSERVALVFFGASMFVSLGVNLTLIPRFGIVGAAIASASGIGIWNLAMLIYVRHKLGIDASAIGLRPRGEAGALGMKVRAGGGSASAP
ncbi:O-antigen/teichoic acid export membrane protein [Sphingomonas sp. F9_3S_D5_B_2]